MTGLSSSVQRPFIAKSSPLALAFIAQNVVPLVMATLPLTAFPRVKVCFSRIPLTACSCFKHTYLFFSFYVIPIFVKQHEKANCFFFHNL